MPEVVDLTLSDSGDEHPARKRQRVEVDEEDSDVEVVDAPARKDDLAGDSGKDLGSQFENDDELQIVGGNIGTVALRDLPHPRHCCGTFKFLEGNHAENERYCDQCYCYVCDVKAAECTMWIGSALPERNHCHASTSVAWEGLKRMNRSGGGGKLSVKAVYDGREDMPNSMNPNRHQRNATMDRFVRRASEAAPRSDRQAPPQNRAGTSQSAGADAIAAALAAATAVEPSPSSHGRESYREASPRSRAKRRHASTSDAPFTAALAAAGAGSSGTAAPKSSVAAGSAQPSSMPAAATSARPAATPPRPSASKPALSKAAQASSKSKAGSGAAAPSSSAGPKGTLVPDPAKDHNMVLIGTITLHVKAAKPHTIAGIRAKLAPHGVVQTRGVPPQDPPAAFHLGNLFETAYNQTKRKMAYKYLKIRVPPPPEEATPLSNQRVRKVTVVDCQGRCAPVATGVTVHKEVTGKQLGEALSRVLQPPLGSDEELVLLLHGASIIKPTQAINDYTCQGDHSSLHAFRLLKSSIPTGKASEPSPDMPLSGMSYHPPKYVLVVHQRRKPRERAGMSPGYHYTEKFGAPLLIPLEEAHRRGGRQADAALSAIVSRALKPLLKAGCSEPSTRPFVLHRGNLHSAPSSSAGTLFSAEGGPTLSSWGEELVMLTAFWGSSQFPVQYDEQQLKEPSVHASAAPSIMKANQDLMKAVKERAEAESKRLSQAQSMVEELRGASYRDRLDPASSASSSTVVAVSVSLEEMSAAAAAAASASSGAGDKSASLRRMGVVKLTVYAAKRTSCCNASPMFRDFDEWGPSTIGKFPLTATMKCLLQNNATVQQHYKDLKELRNNLYRNHALDPRSINGLLAMLQTGERPAAKQPAGLTVQMRPYQLQSLRFMLDAEEKDGGCRADFWVWVKAQGAREGFWFSPLLQRACLDVPDQVRGGFLAEEMGLGKTVEVLALILAAPAPATFISGQPDPTSSKIRCRGTLVVCAVSLVGQWVEEACSKSNGSLKIHQYHGSSRNRDPDVLCQYDLVVTTYQTLASDFQKNGKKYTNDPLQDIHWYRIVFDEGHMVKSGAAAQSRACTALTSDRRWCCTGTPIASSVEDLLGQFAVIHMNPFAKKAFFDVAVKPAFGASRTHTALPDTLIFALQRTMIRHTKNQVLGGEEVLKLPPKTQVDIAVELSAKEQELYMKAYHEAKRVFDINSAGGAAFVNKHLFAFMSLLNPLRRICSGGALTEQDLSVPDAGLERNEMHGEGGPPAPRASSVPDANLVSTEQECSICLDTIDSPMMTPCAHWFCRECILGWLATKSTCSLCRRAITAADLKAGVMPGQGKALALPAPGTEDEDGEHGEPAEAGASGSDSDAPPGTIVCESKVQAVLRELRAMREADPSAKALVFSQYNTTIEWMKKVLVAEGFGYRFISGSMPMKQRARAIEAFQKDPPTTVFLLSMRSGAVGINLTSASHVFLMEPCINPALEEQAIGRSWRMGQQRSVTVKRFYAKGSLEETIIKLVKARRAEAGGSSSSAAAGAQGQEAAGAGPSTSAAAAAAEAEGAGSGAAGATRVLTDKQMLRMSELQQLFGAPSFGTDARGSS